MLLITSDPVISNLRKLPKKKSETHPAEVLKLLQEPHEQATEHKEGSASEDDSSSESYDSIDFWDDFLRLCLVNVLANAFEFLIPLCHSLSHFRILFFA